LEYRVQRRVPVDPVVLAVAAAIAVPIAFAALHLWRRIGSLSCLKACPEGDILGVVDVFQASLSVFLVVAIAAHIGVSPYLGYVWRR
jgi:hypothetical protein